MTAMHPLTRPAHLAAPEPTLPRRRPFPRLRLAVLAAAAAAAACGSSGGGTGSAGGTTTAGSGTTTAGSGADPNTTASSGGSGSAGTGEVTGASGSLAGSPLPLATARFFVAGDSELVILLSSGADSCAELAGNYFVKNENLLTTTLVTFDGSAPRLPTAPGSFTIVDPGGAASVSSGNAALASADRLDATCQSTQGPPSANAPAPGDGLTGTVELTALDTSSTGRVTGSLTVAFRAASSQITASFDATPCPEPPASQAAPACH